MAFKKFIKENFVLALGITLPVLLMIAFMLATILPNMFVEPPKHDLLFSSNHHDYNNRSSVSIKFGVKNNALRITLKETEHSNNYPQRLFRYHSADQTISEISFDYPENATETLLIPELEGIMLNNKQKSPDGYTFKHRRHGRGGLVGEVFSGGGNRYRNQVILSKDGASFTLPTTGDNHYYYNSVNFIGWIVEDK